MPKKNAEFKIEVGNFFISLKVDHPMAYNRVKSDYRGYFSKSRRKFDIRIVVRYKKFMRPKFNPPLIRARGWRLYKGDSCLFIYFPSRKYYSLVKLNTAFNRAEIYTQDPSCRIISYIFPTIFFSLFLIKKGFSLLHACGIISKNRGYLFVASSGGGKSTIAKLAVKKGFRVLNDDRIIIRKFRNRYIMQGSPWHGDVPQTNSGYVYLRDIFFLKKAVFNRVEPMSKITAIEELYKNCFTVILSSDILKNKYEFCFNFAKTLNCIRLNFKACASVFDYLNGYFESNPGKK
ncbi:MAG: hypothetical protein V2A64_02060 [Candidatus Omnitrophota bacterium]